MLSLKLVLVVAALAYGAESDGRLGKVLRRPVSNQQFRQLGTNVVDQQQYQQVQQPRFQQVKQPQYQQVQQRQYQQVQQPQYQQVQQPQYQQVQQPQYQQVKQAQYQQVQQPQYQQAQQKPLNQQRAQLPQQNKRQFQYNQQKVKQYPVNSQNPYFSNPLVQQVIKNPLPNSQLLSMSYADNTRGYPTFQANSLLSRLPSNATKIRPNIVDGFSCNNRIYGYYADIANDCQIFHVCYPLRDVFKADPDVANVPDVTFIFSFICNEYTRFSQDSMTCAWEFEAVPCEYSEQLYPLNENFFKTTTRAPTYPSG